MKKSTARLSIALFCFFWSGLALAKASDAGTKQDKEYTIIETWNFDALIGKKKIGSHTFKVRKNSYQIRVSSSASFDYRVLNIPLFKYEHSANENYDRQFCLESLSSLTRSGAGPANWQNQEISGQRQNNGFRVTGSNEELFDGECLMAFAYWNPEIVEQEELLNAQDGKLVKVSITFTGGTQKDRRYLLEGDGVEIEIIYSVDGKWTGLSSKLRMGRTLKYLLTDYEREVEILKTNIRRALGATVIELPSSNEN